MPSNNEIPQHPVAEFLFQLVKMLTDDNSHYIEWIDGEYVLEVVVFAIFPKLDDVYDFLRR